LCIFWTNGYNYNMGGKFYSNLGTFHVNQHGHMLKDVVGGCQLCPRFSWVILEDWTIPCKRDVSKRFFFRKLKNGMETW